MFTVHRLHPTLTMNFDRVLRSASNMIRNYWSDDQSKYQFIYEVLNDVHDDSQLFWVATINDWVIGIVGLCPGNFSFHSFAIPWLLVHPSYRKLGCARALISAVESHVLENAGTGVLVCCTPIPEVISRLGFVPSVLMPDLAMRVMCKPVGRSSQERAC